MFDCHLMYCSCACQSLPANGRRIGQCDAPQLIARVINATIVSALRFKQVLICKKCFKEHGECWHSRKGTWNPVHDGATGAAASSSIPSSGWSGNRPRAGARNRPFGSAAVRLGPRQLVHLLFVSEPGIHVMVVLEETCAILMNRSGSFTRHRTKGPFTNPNPKLKKDPPCWWVLF